MTPAWVAYAMTRWLRADFGRPVASTRLRTERRLSIKQRYGRTFSELAL